MTRLVLRVTAAVDLVAGAALILTTWDRLYEAFGVSAPDHAVFAQSGGAFVLAIGYLLWIAPRDVRLTHAAAAASTLAHALVAAMCSVWLVEDRGTLTTSEATGLVAVAATCTIMALASALIARRNVAMLLPPG